LALVIFVAARTVAAAPSVLDEAGERVNHGLELYAAGDLEGARREWAGAQSLVPAKPNPYRLLAMVDARLGRCQDAVREADLFLKLAPADDRRRADVESIRAECQRELAPKTGSLKVTTSPPGAEVRLDDEQSASVGVTPLTRPLAVGHHIVFVHKPGFVALMRPVDVAPAGLSQLDVTLAALEPARRGLTSEETFRRAAEAVARQQSQQAEQQHNEEMRLYALNQRRWERDRYLHSRRANLIAGSIISAIGIAMGATGLSYLATRNSDDNRVKQGGLPIAQIKAYGQAADNADYVAKGVGIPGGILCAIGLPILIAGLAKLKVPAALKDAP
jgi:hypothetical protein